MLDVSKLGKGALIQPTAVRDFRLELAGAIPLPSQFSLKDKVGIVKNQNGSSSCVAQAFSYYAEVLNRLETNTEKQLSARDIYSDIFQPQGGSYLKDAAGKLCNSGVVPEAEASSLEGGNPPSEPFMRNRSDITQQAQNDGMTYVSKNYVTWNNTNIDLYKQAIVQGSGCVVACKGNNPCWQTGQILVPDNDSQIVWSHGIYLIGYNDTAKQFEFINSWGTEWGNSGFGFLPYEYVLKGYVSNPITLIDAPNSYYMSLLSIIQNLKDKILALLKLKK